MLDMPLPTFRDGMSAKEMEVEVRKALIALSMAGSNATAGGVKYVSNSESTANVNGTVDKSIYDENGTPILPNTAATYYDCTVKGIKNSVLDIQIYNTATESWYPFQQVAINPGGTNLIVSFATNNQVSTVSSGIGIVPLSIDVIRVYFGAVMGVFNTSSNISWSTASSLGFTRWRVKVIA